MPTLYEEREEMKILQIFIAILLFFIPPILARRGHRKLVTVGSIVIITLLISATTYFRFGLTHRFGWAILGLVVYASIVLMFTIEFSGGPGKQRITSVSPDRLRSR